MPEPELALDDCSHCACTTVLAGYTRERAIQELEEGTLGCLNCMEDEDDHAQCVALFEDSEIVWDGRHG